jgi:orotidine-5'-phosphate decarboxylase
MNSQTRAVSARDRLIVALDVPTRTEALTLVHELSPEVGFFKIGLQLTAEGQALHEVLATGAKFSSI